MSTDNTSEPPTVSTTDEEDSEQNKYEQMSERTTILTGAMAPDPDQRMTGLEDAVSAEEAPSEVEYVQELELAALELMAACQISEQQDEQRFEVRMQAGDEGVGGEGPGFWFEAMVEEAATKRNVSDRTVLTQRFARVKKGLLTYMEHKRRVMESTHEIGGFPLDEYHEALKSAEPDENEVEELFQPDIDEDDGPTPRDLFSGSIERIEDAQSGPSMDKEDETELEAEES
jgi:hypothetical protein